MQKGYVKLGGMGMDDIFARLEHPAALWWPPNHSPELTSANVLRQSQGYKVYKHAALYKGWAYLLDATMKTSEIPES